MSITKRPRRRNGALCVVIGLLAACQPSGPGGRPEKEGTVWYVQSALDAASATPGAGTAEAPFASLGEAEAAAVPGDEIRVLSPPPGAAPLDGGIALKNGQTLRGEESGESPPRITNTDPGRRGGDAVTLADDTTATGLHIVGAAGHAVVGRNVGGVVVSGNRFVGGNLSDLTSVTTGATAGLGVPEFPKGVVAFIHDDGGAGETRANTVSDNEIGGLPSPGRDLTRLGGSGIALHTRGASHTSLVVSGNRISDLGPGFARSGILVDAQGDSRVRVEIEATRVTNAYNSSDGILVVAQHRSVVEGSVRRYEYVGGTPEQGVGNNGIEVATYFGGDWLTRDASEPEMHRAQMKFLMEDSDIEGAGGFGVVVLNLFGKPSADTVLDFGGGELGGHGGNRIVDSGGELPLPLDVFLVHQDLDMTNNWWGADRSATGFLCPGEPEQLQALTDGTGTSAWSMFCQTFRPDVCTAGDASADCCDPSTDPARCLVHPADSSLRSAPALPNDPRP